MATPTSLPPPIFTLPVELHIHIFSFLDAVNTTRLALTCNYFYQIHRRLHPYPISLSTHVCKLCNWTGTHPSSHNNGIWSLCMNNEQPFNACPPNLFWSNNFPPNLSTFHHFDLTIDIPMLRPPHLSQCPTCHIFKPTISTCWTIERLEPLTPPGSWHASFYDVLMDIAQADGTARATRIEDRHYDAFIAGVAWDAVPLDAPSRDVFADTAAVFELFAQDRPPFGRCRRCLALRLYRVFLERSSVCVKFADGRRSFYLPVRDATVFGDRRWWKRNHGELDALAHRFACMSPVTYYGGREALGKEEFFDRLGI